jgi:arylsulfatase A
MLLTGKYNFRNYTRWGKMDTSERTIANMLKDAGYKTACYGKWQFEGGDASVHAFGFDRYCIWSAFQQEGDPRYKSPHLYTNGAFIADEETHNKYSEDIFIDSVLNFLDSNKSTPFFVYYPMVLAHSPFSPTPDDSDFSTWSDSDVVNNVSDTSYYHSMIKYMDEKIGQIVNKVKTLGIENNTAIIYVGDNGTPGKVTEIVDDTVATGQKGKTNIYGTHVPLIVYWPGTVNAGVVNNNLVDFTDFLPTIAGIANNQLPTTYGPLDGVSFFPQLTGQTATPRDWIFFHYDPHPHDNRYRRWVQNATYKLYDTSFYKHKRTFYNIALDPRETNAIPDSTLTDDERSIQAQFIDVINSYRAQGTPLLSETDLSATTDSSSIATDTIYTNGGSTISSSGVVWSTDPNPTLLTGSYSSGTAGTGWYKSNMHGLSASTTYYVRSYAINFAGVGYGKQKIFRTHLGAPHAVASRAIDTSSFIAKWNNLSGATSYRLDVSTLQTFCTFKLLKLNEGFDSGITAPKGWKISSGIVASTKKFGLAAPSLQFRETGQQVTTKVLFGPAVKLSFWLQGSIGNPGNLLVEGFNGINWTTIDNLTNIKAQPAVVLYDSLSTPRLGSDFTQFRFTYTKTNGLLFFDDISINFNKITPSFLTGYEDLVVNDTAQSVTGLTRNANYYYRVRATNADGSSPNSNVISAKACNPPLITNVTSLNLLCSGDNGGSIQLSATGVAPLLYNWSGPDGFTSSNKDINNVAAGTYKIIVTSNDGCATDSSVVLTEPAALSATLSANPILCNGGTTSLIATATGGTGSYHYTLSDSANNLTGPQNDSQFVVSSGAYVVTVTDDNGCSFTTDTLQVTEPQALTASASADPIPCIGGTTILTVTAQGGTGNYHYTLSDSANNTTGPQDDNHFTVAAGSYTAMVTDDNGCLFTAESIQVNDGTNGCGGMVAVNGNQSKSGNITAKNNSELNASIYPNPSSTAFTLRIQSNENANVKITILDVYGREVYQAEGSGHDTFLFGAEFVPGTYLIKVMQGKNITTLKILKGT